VVENVGIVGGAGSVDPERLTEEGRKLRRAVHKTIKKVTDDIEDRFHFNTAIAAVMELTNALYAFEPKKLPLNAAVLKEGIETTVLLLAPFVPHISEELWQALGHQEGMEKSVWPSFDSEAVVEDEVLIVVQVNGKLRGKINVEAGASEEAVRGFALADEKVKAFIDGKNIRKVIYVPGKLLNIVVG
jgi:leucyl-tRNA synthetase